jgi:hypothetical protein
MNEQSSERTNERVCTTDDGGIDKPFSYRSWKVASWVDKNQLSTSTITYDQRRGVINIHKRGLYLVYTQVYVHLVLLKQAVV